MISGELQADGTGVLLRLFEPLSPAADTWDGAIGPTPVNDPLVHGRLLDGPEDVTVLGVSGVTLRAPFAHGHLDLLADAALLGGHADGKSFDRVRIQFDVLDAWADPPPLVLDDDPSLERAVVRIEDLELAAARVGPAQIRLLSLVHGRWGDSVHLDQDVVFDVSAELAGIDEWAREWVRPLGDLLVVCLGRPATVTDMRVLCLDDHRDRVWLRVVRGLVQPEPSKPEPARMRSWDAPTLLLPDDSSLPFAELLPTWFSMLDDLGEAVTLLCAPHYAPFMFGEHRYASTFQAAEALARRVFPGKEMTRREHRARVDAVVNAAAAAGVPDDTVRWAQNLLQARNDRTLRALLQDLLDDAGPVGAAVRSAAPDAPARMARARTSVSHGGAPRESAHVQYWLGQTLAWIVRMHLLREAGVPPDIISDRVLAKAGFRQALDQIMLPTSTTRS